MKTIIIILSLSLLCFVGKAQWVVSDPGNLAQGIVNSSNQIVEASKTVNNTLDNFKETKKIFEQGKAYYDALKSVHNLVKDARKVQKIVLFVGEISEIYVTNFQRMLSDDNYSPEELEVIAEGYRLLMEQSTELLSEVKQIITPSGLSLNDSERLTIIDKVYDKVKRYRDLVSYYTRKNISLSYIRAEKKGTLNRVMSLYGNDNAKYW